MAKMIEDGGTPKNNIMPKGPRERGLEALVRKQQPQEETDEEDEEG